MKPQPLQPGIFFVLIEKNLASATEGKRRTTDLDFLAFLICRGLGELKTARARAYILLVREESSAGLKGVLWVGAELRVRHVSQMEPTSLAEWRRTLYMLSEMKPELPRLGPVAGSVASRSASHSARFQLETQPRHPQIQLETRPRYVRPRLKNTFQFFFSRRLRHFLFLGVSRCPVVHASCERDAQL
jgi:hypothetical protein